jgi:L-fuculose-phosphate aldolase
MGIKTGGLPVPGNDKNIRTAPGLQEEMIESIVQKVTEEVLKNVLK